MTTLTSKFTENQLTKNKLSEQLMLKQALAAVLEKIINKALSLNINDNSSLQPLADKSLTVQLDELSFPLTFMVCQQQILVTSSPQTSDCTIVTSLQTLKALQQQQAITELIKQDKLDLQGDIKIAQQFAAIAKHLQIDWQTELAHHIGDIPTYKLTQLGKKLADKFNFFKNQVQADISEYVVYEKQLIVTQQQIHSFNQQVNEVSQHAEQLMQRLTSLMNTKQQG